MIKPGIAPWLPTNREQHAIYATNRVNAPRNVRWSVTMPRQSAGRWLTTSSGCNALACGCSCYRCPFCNCVIPYHYTGEWLYYRFHVMRLDRYVGAFMYVILCMEVLVLMFITYFIGREIRKIYKERKAYFKVSEGIAVCNQPSAMHTFPN